MLCARNVLRVLAVLLFASVAESEASERCSNIELTDGCHEEGKGNWSQSTGKWVNGTEKKPTPAKRKPDPLPTENGNRRRVAGRNPNTPAGRKEVRSEGLKVPLEKSAALDPGHDTVKAPLEKGAALDASRVAPVGLVAAKALVLRASVRGEFL
ncbi:hypothetical protein ERJ75_001207900 [Trypanosoma vivax]|nr:hypothetical protein ERJ75_001207900 [Trypanosoma vivax]